MLLPPRARRGRPPENERPHPHRGNPITHHVAGPWSEHRDKAGRPRAVTTFTPPQLLRGDATTDPPPPSLPNPTAPSPASRPFVLASLGRSVLTPAQSAVSSHQQRSSSNKHIPY